MRSASERWKWTRFAHHSDGCLTRLIQLKSTVVAERRANEQLQLHTELPLRFRKNIATRGLAGSPIERIVPTICTESCAKAGLHLCALDGVPTGVALVVDVPRFGSTVGRNACTNTDCNTQRNRKDPN